MKDLDYKKIKKKTTDVSYFQRLTGNTFLSPNTNARNK